MLITLRNSKHGTTVKFRVSHSGQVLERAMVTRLRRKLCPVGCCPGYLPQSGPRHKTARSVMILILGGVAEVYFKQSFSTSEGIQQRES